jgi:hypothetical protein
VRVPLFRCCRRGSGVRDWNHPLLDADADFTDFPVPGDSGMTSLLWRINSLFAANRFPVPVELFPCSVAQGICG